MTLPTIDVLATPISVVAQYVVPESLDGAVLLCGAGVVSIVVAASISFQVINKTGRTVLNCYPGAVGDAGANSPTVSFASVDNIVTGGVLPDLTIPIPPNFIVREGDILQAQTSEVAGSWSNVVFRLAITT